MKLTRKSVALVLAVLLLAAALPVAFAAETNPESLAIPLTESAEVVQAPESADPVIPDSEEDADETVPVPPTTEPEPTETVPETEPPKKPAPVYVSPRIDYSELTRQIAIANGLNEKEYTKESWQQMQESLEWAESRLTNGNQRSVDNATEGLKSALTALVKMDYSALQDGLNAVAELDEPNDMYDVWVRLIAAAEKAREQVGSGDQAAVDACAQELAQILAELDVCLEALGNPQVVIQEVEVEVPPSSDYCNIAMHHVWPVLFFCSLAVNIGLAVLIVLIVRKKKNQTDDTPLVDYDIGLDDMDDLDDDMDALAGPMDMDDVAEDVPVDIPEDIPDAVPVDVASDIPAEPEEKIE